MTTKYENVKTTIFATKEHYLAFRKAWCEYVNSDDAKPYYFDCKYGGGKTKACRLNAEHHLLFCILTETDLSLAFKPSPTGRKNGFEEAYSYSGVRHYALMASLIVKARSGEGPKLSKDREAVQVEGIENFLKPFGKTVTVEMLTRLYDEFIVKEQLTNVVNETKEAA